MSRTARTAILAGILIVLVYPLSYAPLDRYLNGPGSFYIFLTDDTRLDDAFHPVVLLEGERLIGVGRFLSWWSDMWGVGKKHRQRASAPSIRLWRR